MNSLASTLLTVTMIAALALLVGGVRLARAPGERRRGALMIGAGLVLVGNVLIWTL